MTKQNQTNQENYKFFSHKDCEFFPCHKVSDEETFNCLFCYCPLYALGRECGGNFTFTENGIKDCSSCLVPHGAKAYDHVMSKMGLLMEIAKDKG